MNNVQYYEIKVSPELNKASSSQNLPKLPLLYQKLVERICVCCLIQTGPFVNLATCKHVEFLRTVPEIACNYDDKLVCNNCHDLLKKFSLFQQQVKENVTSVLTKVTNIQVNKKILNLNFKPTEYVNIDNFDSMQAKDPIEFEIEVVPGLFDSTGIKEEYISDSDNELDLPLCVIKNDQEKHLENQIVEHIYRRENSDKAENNKRPEKNILLKAMLENKLKDVVIPTKDNDVDNTYIEEDFSIPAEKSSLSSLQEKVKMVKLTEKQMLAEREKDKKKYENYAFKCAFCFMGFNQEVSCKEHIKRRHFESPNVCSICKSAFKWENTLNSHYLAHYKRFQCMDCGARYTTLRSAYDHYSAVHNKIDETFKCPKCDFVTDNSRKFRYHKDQHKFKECKYCNKIFKTGITCKNHVLSVHENLKNQKNYICKECGKGFVSLCYYNNHMKRSHGGGPKSYCAECDVEFTSEFSLKHHMKHSKKHNHIEKNFICDHCNKKFELKCYLRVHIQFEHLKSINNRCSICNKNFMRPQQLVRHIEFVHNKKQVPRSHICDHCGKGFTSRGILASHIRTHTGERPYKCSNCPATFAHSAARYTHNKLVHRVRGGRTEVGNMHKVVE